ncbi:MAG: ABC transporter ATP-binding protein [Oscillospiraceae bacterium]
MAKQKKADKPKTGLARIFELAENRKGLLVVSGILSALAAVASFVPYLAIYFIIRDVLAVYPNIALLDTQVLLSHGLLALAGIAADVLCYLASSICAHIAAFGTQYQLKRNFTRHLARIPLGFHLTIGSGRFRKVIDSDIEKIESFLAHQFPDIVASFTAPVVMLAVMFGVDWRFGLACLAAVIIAFVLQMMTFGAAGPELMTEMQKAMADMNSASIEYVRGMPVLKAFGQTARSFKQLYAAIKAYTKFMLTYTMKWENYTAAFQTVVNNIYLLVLPVGILLGQGVGDYPSFALTFVFFLLFAPSIASVLNKLMYVSSASMRIAGGVANLDQMMALPELEEPSPSRQPRDGEVRFDNVTFSYNDPGGEVVLRGVSFTAAAGSVTAIVGPSGSGKSTIAHLIPRFWDVGGGSISIGGADIRQMHSDDLMRMVSFVFQDITLFGQSIADNIRMGSQTATLEEVQAAAKAARCHDFIQTLPRGYDTVVGEEGVHLSGGEAQRIAIARAIVKDAPILVLDEATAFADPENEQLIQQALAALMRNKTVIMIAHRLGTVTSADNIVVMDKGTISQQGTHRQLLEQGGLYSCMWQNYTQSLAWRLGREEVWANGLA